LTGKIISNFDTCNDLPPERLISNVNIVPFIDDKCVLIKLDCGKWEIPGGTLEVNEDFRTALKRELLEEAGAKLVSAFTVFGAWKFISSAETPYRSHIPHPIYYRIVGFGDIQLVSAPVIPEDGEVVISVEVITLSEAKLRFIDSGRPDLAELYEIADNLRRKMYS
jgi:8-oxo-dGTP pyrophosphatase MutT (NUDIX family)